MNVGIIIGRYGGVDGVALETEKWVHVMQRMGHHAYILSGEYEGQERPGPTRDLVPLLAFSSSQCQWEQKHAFLGGVASESEVLESIQVAGSKIASAIEAWVTHRSIDLLLPENACALPYHLSMGVGIKLAVKRLGLPVVTHDHDFAWERGRRYVSPHPGVNQLVKQTFPLVMPGVGHAVINSASAETLLRKHQVSSIVVPNVMDFQQSYGQKDVSNAGMSDALGLTAVDIPLFQVTRVVRRKGLETAVELVHRLRDLPTKLVVTGTPEDDDSGYFEELTRQIRSLGLEHRVLFAGDRIGNRPDPARGMPWGLSDAYAHAAACTFFSTYEGFGNAFVECVLARKPIFVNNYRPVYWPDIGSKGFKTVQLEDGSLTDDAVEKVRSILTNRQLAREIGEHNFGLGRRHFSYEVLQDKLETLLTQGR
jgi:mannosylglucosylglycerate synthase